MNTLTPLISFPNVPRWLPQRRPPPLRTCCSLTFDKSCSSLTFDKPCSTVAFDKTRGGKGMSWFHEIKLQVREYELDQYGVVNNSVYSSYCEYGTHKLVEKIGFDDDPILAVAEASVKYIAPLRKNDKFLLKARIYDYSTIRFYFEDFIFKLPNLEPILKSKYTVVLLDKNLHPSRISPSMISKFNQFRLMETNGSRYRHLEV